MMECLHTENKLEMKVCMCLQTWFESMQVAGVCVSVINCHQSNNKVSLETDCLLLEQRNYAVHHYPPSFLSPLLPLHHSYAITELISPSPAGTSFTFLPSSSPLHWSSS